jgi:curli production assembly/transport component CsgG/holdfast attachment protein HfaB
MTAVRIAVVAALLAPTLAACVSATPNARTGLYAKPIGGAPATANDTMYSSALTCLAQTARQRGRAAPRIAVAPVSDLTGRVDFDTGRKVSQGASLFAVAALSKAGAPVVERMAQEISQTERALATDHVLSDAPGEAGASADNFRAVYAGEIAGSRYYIVGGITELNYNLTSNGVDVAGGEIGMGLKATATASSFVMNAAVDLRMVDTVTQEVVATASYQKRIVGRQLKGGLIDIYGAGLYDLSAGGSAVEPLQFATRTLVERGVYDFAADLYGVDRAECLREADGPAESLLRKRVLAEQTRAAAPPKLAALPPGAVARAWDPHPESHLGMTPPR